MSFDFDKEALSLWDLPAHTDSHEPNFLFTDFLGEPVAVCTCIFFIFNSIRFAYTRWPRVQKQHLESICNF
jgi:hypothetical protein